MFLCLHFVECLRSDIGNQGYSLLLDESNDISVVKYLGVAIVYVSLSLSEVISTYLSLEPLEKCDAQSLVNAVEKVLQKFKLPKERLLLVLAQTMIGANEGVYEKLKRDKPGLILTKCLCHSLQLAVSHAASEHLPRNLEFLISETYNWFCHSSLRQATYKVLYQAINDGHEPLKIVQACITRWMSIHTAVERVCTQWVELKTHFQIAKLDEKCYKADILYQMYADESNLVYFLFLKSVLCEVSAVNKSFESNNANSTKLSESLFLLLNSIYRKLVLPSYYYKFDIMTCNIDDYVDSTGSLGYEADQCLSQLKLDPEKKKMIKDRSIKFLIELFKQIRQRIPDNISVLKEVSNFSVENALRVIKPSVVPLMQLMQKNPDEITKAENQWQNLTLVKWNETGCTVKFWSEVHKYKNPIGENPFSQISSVALEVLSIPHSNAEVERISSQMAIVKSKLQNQLKVKMLNSILTIRAGLRRTKKTCFQYELPEAVTSIIGTKETYVNRHDDLEEEALEEIFFI